MRTAMARLFLALCSASVLLAASAEAASWSSEGELVHRPTAPTAKRSPHAIHVTPATGHDEEYPKPLAMLDTADSCSVCTSLVTAAGEATQNKTEMAALLSLMQSECALNASTALICDIVSAAIVKELPKLPQKLVNAGVYTPVIACSLLGQCSVPNNEPSQIHLSVAGAGSADMAVVWATADSSADRNVRYGTDPSSLTSVVSADSHGYTAGGWVGAIHSAVMTGLKAGQLISYQVGGDSSGWSPVRNFTAPAEILRPEYTFLVTGDMGAERNFSGADQDWINFAATQPKTSPFAVDAIIHIGDISYADGYMERWDELFNALQPAASRVPYMTVPGNHEIDFNFTSYQNRFSMPTTASGAPFDGMFYSFDQGCVHFVGLNTETAIDTPNIDAQQVAWLQADLAAFAARRQAGREARAARLNGEADEEEEEVIDDACSASAPTFLVVYMHRPMYCSTGGTQGAKRCGKEAPYLRSLVEDIFVKYEVDLVFAGHVHAYERTTNVYKNQADPRGPVYILNGVGGNREGVAKDWQSPLPAYSQAHLSGLGMGTLQVVNSTTLAWSFFQQTDLAVALQNGSAPPVYDQTIIRAR